MELGKTLFSTLKFFLQFSHSFFLYFFRRTSDAINFIKRTTKMSKIVNSKPLTDVLPEKFKFLAENGPCVKLNGNADNIEILSTPAQFNDTLCYLATNSKRKIGLATLYMDNSEKSLQLINSCEKALSDNAELECHFLGDYPRGCRGADSTRQVCLPLKKKFPKRARISLYHTPYLRGFWKFILPKKLDETIGVQHSKLYLFDDDVVMSGANLSHIYFTNRQDRYIHFKNQPELVELLWKIFRAIQKLSIEVDENDQEYFNLKVFNKLYYSVFSKMIFFKNLSFFGPTKF